MSRTYKDKPVKYQLHLWTEHEPGFFRDATNYCEACEITHKKQKQHKNHLQAHSRGEAKVRKFMKRQTARGARRTWMSNAEYRRLKHQTINYQVWLY